MPFSHIILPSPSPTESKRLFNTSVSLLLSHIQGYHYLLSKFHINVLVYCIGVFLSGTLLFFNYLIYLFYFTILYWFCLTLTWICHGWTCIPHPEPPSHLPPHPIHLGHPSAAAKRAPCIMHQTWTGNLFHIWYFTCFNAILQYHPALALSHRVQDVLNSLLVSILIRMSVSMYTLLWLSPYSTFKN